MKAWNYLTLSIAMLTLPALTGCAGCQNKWKHIEAQAVGLDRKITLYGADGHEIRAWETTATVEDEGGSCYFLDKDGKAVIVSGTFVIEEK